MTGFQRRRVHGVCRRIEETLSNQIRNLSPGDNYDAEMWPGQAFYEETYWKVPWPWITLPVVEVLVAASVLALSIVATNTHPLFKSSSLALLYHGLEDIDKDPELRGDWDNHLVDLEHRARYIEAELKKDANGSLKFMKIPSSSCLLGTRRAVHSTAIDCMYHHLSKST